MIFENKNLKFNVHYSAPHLLIHIMYTNISMMYHAIKKKTNNEKNVLTFEYIYV